MENNDIIQIKRRRVLQLADSLYNSTITQEEYDELQGLLERQRKKTFHVPLEYTKIGQIPCEIWLLIAEYLWEEKHENSALLPLICKDWKYFYEQSERLRFRSWFAKKGAHHIALCLVASDTVRLHYYNRVYWHLYVPYPGSAKTDVPRSEWDENVRFEINWTDEAAISRLTHCEVATKRFLEQKLGWPSDGSGLSFLVKNAGSLLAGENSFLDYEEDALHFEYYSDEVPCSLDPAPHIEPVKIPQSHVFYALQNQPKNGEDYTLFMNDFYGRIGDIEFSDKIYQTMRRLNVEKKMW